MKIRKYDFLFYLISCGHMFDLNKHHQVFLKIPSTCNINLTVIEKMYKYIYKRKHFLAGWFRVSYNCIVLV